MTHDLRNPIYQAWPYAITDLATGERGVFASIRSLRIYLWGRDLGRYAVARCGLPMAFTRVMA